MGFIEIVLLIGTVIGGGTDSTEAAVLSRVEAFAEAFRAGDVETDRVQRQPDTERPVSL